MPEEIGAIQQYKDLVKTVVTKKIHPVSEINPKKGIENELSLIEASKRSEIKPRPFAETKAGILETLQIGLEAYPEQVAQKIDINTLELLLTAEAADWNERMTVMMEAATGHEGSYWYEKNINGLTMQRDFHLRMAQRVARIRNGNGSALDRLILRTYVNRQHKSWQEEAKSAEQKYKSGDRPFAHSEKTPAEVAQDLKDINFNQRANVVRELNDSKERGEQLTEEQAIEMVREAAGVYQYNPRDYGVTETGYSFTEAIAYQRYYEVKAAAHVYGILAKRINQTIAVPTSAEVIQAVRNEQINLPEVIKPGNLQIDSSKTSI